MVTAYGKPIPVDGLQDHADAVAAARRLVELLDDHGTEPDVQCAASTPGSTSTPPKCAKRFQSQRSVPGNQVPISLNSLARRAADPDMLARYDRGIALDAIEMAENCEVFSRGACASAS